MKVYCVTNQKGGVGKSTTCACIGAALTEDSKRVLLIDLDPQAGLTVSLGFDPDTFPRTVYDVLIGADGATLSSVIQETKVPRLHLAPANLDLSAAEAELLGEIGWERMLSQALRDVEGRYDYAIVDCPPSLGVLTTNALAAASLAIVPLQTEYLALRGLKQLYKIVSKVRQRSNPGLQVRVLRTMFDARTAHAREVFDEIASVVGREVFTTSIKRTVRFPDASVAGLPLVVFDPSHDASQAYRDITKEILSYDQATIPAGTR